MKISPNLIVPSIEACLPLWIDRLEFKKTAEVPDGDALGFVILARDDVQVMLQSERSLAADITAAPSGPYRAVLYVSVASLAEVQRALAGYTPTLVAERTTFYGARETVVLDPAGNMIVLAEHTHE